MTFLSPLFLWLLPLASLPVIIHLLNRRRSRRIRFPTLIFLQPSTRRTLKKFRLLQALLLAMRVLIILLLTLAFARPMWRGFTSGEGSFRYILLIDNSYSMQYRTARGTALSTAKDLAAEAVKRLDGQFAVGAFNRNLPEFLPYTADRQEALAEIEKINFSAYTTCYVTALRELTAVLGDDPGPHRVIIFSDFNADGFGSAGYFAARDLQLLLVDVNDGTENIWFERLELPEAFANIPAGFSAGIKPEGSPASVSLVIEGERRHQLEHNPAGKLEFNYTFDTPGIYSGWLEMEEDTENNRIRMDSVRYFTISVRPRLRVLLVDGSPGYTLMEGQSFFAARALAPGNYRTPAVPEVVTSDEFKRISLDRYDAVLLLDVHIDEDIARAVSGFSASGGGVGVFSGNNMKAAGRFIRSLMPVEIDAASPEARDVRGPVRSSGAFRDIFEDDEVFEFSRMIRTGGVQGNTPALSIGDIPLLWLYSPGGGIRGNTAFFTSSANMVWSDFAVTPAFPAFIHEIVRFLAASPEDGRRPLTAGSEITAEPGAVLSVITSEGEKNITAPIASIPGIYRPGAGAVAVNADVSSGEPALTPASLSEMKKFFVGPEMHYIQYSENLLTEFLRAMTGEDRSGIFLIAAFILLAAEEFLRKSLSTGEAA